MVANSDKVFVDGLEHVLHRGTPVVALMVTRGTLDGSRCELGAVVCGDQPGRKDPRQRIFFSPIGMGIEDVCLCYRAYKLAARKGHRHAP